MTQQTVRRRVWARPLRTAAAGALMLAITAEAASAAVWQWGCLGAMGNDQIAFNRERLVLIAGKAPAGKLDDFVLRGEFTSQGKKPSGEPPLTETFQAEDSNGGFDKEIKFKGEDTRTLKLTELSSSKIANKSRLIAHCRDETFDRFRKSYRVERDGEPPRVVTLVCLEYMLTTKGGRTCR